MSSKKGNRDYIHLSIITVLGLIITVVVFYGLYNVSRRSLINMWNSNAILMSQEIEYYLNQPKDAVIFTSKRVETLIDKGATNEQIQEYLVDESEVFSHLIEGNTTGVYAFCNGEYLDGSGWDPTKGYSPKERPWYVDAKRAGGEVVFVEPYLNVQTNTLMMSVSKLLKDKESVVSMDFYLDSIQKMDEEMLENNKLEAALVIDTSGLIVSHSDENEIGKNYSNDGISFHKAVFSKVITSNGKNFTADRNGVEKLIFSKRINNEWFTVLIFDESTLFASLKYLYLVSLVVLFAVFSGFFMFFSIYQKKHKETMQLQNDLAAIAGIYSSLSILDVKDLKLNKMWVSEKLTNILAAGNFSLTNVDEIVQAIAAEPSRSMLAHFMDFSTLDERLKDIKSVSHDFLNIENKWTRMTFIASEWDADGNLEQVIWATEIIDEDKRRQDALRKKAETDALTSILNRSGGEAKLFDTFEKGRKGMLLLIDADHFKYVNDNYGHDVGDKVIKAIANCLTDTFRDSDIVFRIGGDEFSVYATGVVDKEIGRIVADRLFMAIDMIRIPEIKDWKVKISVGATFCNPKKNNSFTEYYKQVDKAMYESKQYDGNYITFAE